MTKQRKHAKKSTIKKKRRMRQHAMEHSKVAHDRSYLHSEYAPYTVTKDWSDG